MKEKLLKRAIELSSIIDINQNKMDELKANVAFNYSAPVMDRVKAADMIDHTVLSFNADAAKVDSIVDEAIKYNFKAICINPVWIKRANERRKDNKFLIATVIDFPLGASTAEMRIAEAKKALEDGADELDLVISVGLLKSGMIKETFELMTCVRALGGYLKVILETSELTENEKIDAALLAFFAGADMLKTSTGVNGTAKVSDVELLRAVAGKTLGVKAAGGIRDKETLLAMAAAGADRIGCSSSVKIYENW